MYLTLRKIREYYSLFTKFNAILSSTLLIIFRYSRRLTHNSAVFLELSRLPYTIDKLTHGVPFIPLHITVTGWSGHLQKRSC